MKKVLFIYIFMMAGFAFAIDSVDNLPGFDTPIPSVPEGTDAYEINIINIIETINYEIYNLDFIEPDEILIRAYECIYLIDADDGTHLDSWNYTFGNSNPIGLAAVNSHIHVNDGIDTVIYKYDGSIWTTYENPCGNDGKGMGFDGTYIWEIAADSYLYKFDTNGILNNSWTLPVSISGIRGMTLFPSGSNQGIAINWTNLSQEFLNIYEVNGSTLTYLGAVTLPNEHYSFGLAYSETRETFFWSWMNEFPGGYLFGIYEFELIETGLEQTTWGAIKTSF